MKMKTIIILSLLLVLPIVLGAGGDYADYVTIGLGDSRWCNIINGCNYTGRVYAEE